METAIGDVKAIYYGELVFAEAIMKIPVEPHGH